jgi:K+-transporting ATPase KdpF subunit
MPCSIPFSSLAAWGSSSSPCSTSSLAIACEDIAMIFDYILGSIVSLVITVYLIYALVNPERF